MVENKTTAPGVMLSEAHSFEGSKLSYFKNGYLKTTKNDQNPAIDILGLILLFSLQEESKSFENKSDLLMSGKTTPFVLKKKDRDLEIQLKDKPPIKLVYENKELQGVYKKIKFKLKLTKNF